MRDYRHEDGAAATAISISSVSSSHGFRAGSRHAWRFCRSFCDTVLESVLLHTSLRYDDPDDFDSETSAQAGVKYSVGGGVTLAANWGEAYKLPSFLALGHPLVGNPDLQPEQGESWDLGLRVGKAMTAGVCHATWFNNDFRDLVDFDDGDLP